MVSQCRIGLRRYIEDLPVDTILGNKVLASIGEKYSKSIAQIVLRWHIEIGVIPLPKTENSDRLKENFNIFDFELDPSDHQAILMLETGVRTGFDPEHFN